MKTLLLFCCLALLAVDTATAVASKKQQDFDNWVLSNHQGFMQLPTIYDEMVKHETMTPARRQQLMAEWRANKPAWEKEQAANKAKDLAFRKKKEKEAAAMSPAQRLAAKRQWEEKEARRVALSHQADQARYAAQARRRAAVGAVLGAIGNGLANQAQAAPRVAARPGAPLYNGAPSASQAPNAINVSAPLSTGTGPRYLQDSRWDLNSLANPYGAGSVYKPDGLLNPNSQYTSRYSNTSYTNPYATNAPKLYDGNGQYRGRLSANKYDPDSISNPNGRYGNKNSPDSLKNPYWAGNPYWNKQIYVQPQ